MSWLQNLYLTYEICKGIDEKLLPLFHMYQNTHIEIILDKNGNFLDAKREDLKNTLIPCTEKSEGARTNDPPSHPLCDKLMFVAKDFPNVFGGKSYFHKYENLLKTWVNSKYSNNFICSIYNYITKGNVINDLLSKNIFTENEKSDPKKIADLFVRWVIEIPGVLETRCWKNKEIIESWQNFYLENNDSLKNVCYVLGKESPIAINHPKRIRNSADGGKLISTNDTTGFTFRGRFEIDTFYINDKKQEIAIQPVSLSVEISQKAHRALSWLIERQGFKNDTQTIVAWAIKEDPYLFKPVEDTWSLFDDREDEIIEQANVYNYFDAGQTFAKKLNNKLKGYHEKLGSTDQVVIMGLDSVVPGRIAITYYRELTGSEFLERIENWHNQMAWHFNIFIETGKNKKEYKTIIKAPSLPEIAESCYGIKRDDDFYKFRKRVIEKLLPCVIDGATIPYDLVNQIFNKVINPLAYSHEKKYQWELALSTFCSLYKCFSLRNLNPKIIYNMALENDRNDRDYLYGRLLAVAVHIEQIALNVAGESRETTAERFMQRFAEKPFSTWRNIELALRPYISRLNTNRTGFLINMQKLLDEIYSKFKPGDFENDTRLNGSFILAYHCQRLELKNKKDSTKEDEIINEY